jgi:acyl-CoA synthetase (AMP-forming)/AMP-acid ligase II
MSIDPISALEGVLTIPELLTHAAHRYGQSLAIEDERSLTYRELGDIVRRAAKAFMARGVDRGDRVAIWAPNGWRWIVAALGLQTAGAVLVPLNTRFKGREAAYILRKSGAKLLLTVDSFLGIDYSALLREEALPTLQETLLLSSGDGSDRWDAFLKVGEGLSDEAVRERMMDLGSKDPSDILFTSGTTGNPKGVLTTHGQNLRTYEIYTRTMGLQAGDRYLIVNPFFNTFGYKAGWLSALMCGATVLPHAVFDALEILKRIERDRVSVLPGPPTLYQSILALPNFRDYDRSTLRLATTGSSTVPTELVRRMKTDLGFNTVLTAYGMTETSGVISMCSPSDDVETVATTSGRAIEGVQVRVIDERGHDLPSNSPGEVLVRGFNIMQGYFEDSEETAKAIDAQGWLHTGDIGVVNEGGYIRITDRKKDMFIVGGFNCYPAEIENILLSHPDILQAAVVGMADERLGEVAKAYLVPRPGAALEPEAVITWARSNMANYKVPRAVELRAALPLNASGKVQKFLLK